MKVKTSVTRAWASVLTGTAATESTAIISSSSQVKVVNRCRTASVAISSAKRSVPMFYSRRNIPTSHFSFKQVFKFCVVLVDDEPAEMLEIRQQGTWRKSSDKTSRTLGNSSLSDGRQPTDYSVRWCLSVNGRYKREIPPSGGQKKQSVTSRVWLIPLQRRRRRKTIGSGRSLDDNFFRKIQSNQKRRGRRRLLEDDEITLCSDWLRKWTPNRAAINADYSDAFHLIPTIRMRRRQIKSVSLWNNSLHKFIVVTFRTFLNFAANLYFRKFHWF